MPRQPKALTIEQENAMQVRVGGDALPTPQKPPREVRINSLYEIGRLAPDGSPSPPMVARNRMEMGFTCPEQEYIQSAQLPSIAYLARRWGQTECGIEKWRDENNWDERRTLEWKRVENLAFENGKEKIAGVRAAEQARQRGDLIILHEIVMEKVKHGVAVESTATGDIYERPFTIKGMKDTAQAMVLINTGINDSLGIARNLGRQDEDKMEETGPRVKRVTHRHTVERVEETLELPVSEVDEVATFPQGRTFEALPLNEEDPAQ